MFPPTEIAKNLPMRSKTLSRLARRRHYTGVLADGGNGERVLERFTSGIPFALDGARVLELGPGRGLELLRAAAARGAECAAFDVVDYLGELGAELAGIDYRVDSSGDLPWMDGAFDIVWSHSVLEHVREPFPVLKQVARVLRPGGFHVASIDLENHLGGRGDPQKMFEFLRYSESTWNLMTSHRSTYVNRLRLSEWRRLLRDAGFEITEEDTVTAACGVEALRSVDYLAHLSDEDISTKLVMFTAHTTRRATEPANDDQR